MRDALLRPEQGDDLREWVELESEATLHPLGDGLPVVRPPEPESVAAEGRRAPGFRESVDRGRRCREIGVAGTEIDHIDAACDQIPLLLRDRGKRVRGERRDSARWLRHAHASDVTVLRTELT